MSETDKKSKLKEISDDFSSVVDATAEFLKKIFPHAYKLSKKKDG